MPILTLQCACENGRLWIPRRGGNDPDGDMVICEACDGSGEIVRLCTGFMCNEPATELVTLSCGAIDPCCHRCAQTARENAGMEPESRGFW